MDFWTLVELGLLVIPVAALAFVVLDLLDAYTDLEIVEMHRTKSSVEYRHAIHVFLTQFVRGVVLFVIATVGLLALVGVLDRNLLAILFYVMTIVLSADSIRARITRKSLVKDWENQFSKEQSTDG